MKLAILIALALTASAWAHEHEARALAAAPQQLSPGLVQYGAAMPANPEARRLSLALADADIGKAQKLSGRVGQVCQAEGCWMMLTDGDVAVRVKFADHAFVIPKDSQGEALVFGQLEQIELSEAQARHMAEDAGKSGAEVKGPQKEYRVLATSVQIRNML